jgi:threonyl-tRNA synthetase
MINKLTACLRAHYPAFGFREVLTPTMYKKSLWERSGHWENYKEDMFGVQGRSSSENKIPSSKTEGDAAPLQPIPSNEVIEEEDQFGLKPMNCPGHCLLFATETRSYRELPIRYADFSALHRNENSGSLSGLTRVRRFHQDDGHIFCRADQVRQEIMSTLDFVELLYKEVFDLPGYRLVLSTRPEDGYIGTTAEWDVAETQLKQALDASGRSWTLSPGDGAFYGPKIDIILQDNLGREHQTATIQLDFQLPQRFELKYQNDEQTLESITPVLIHRAVLGSLERFLALLIEHYNGIYPFWLSPRPVKILTINTAPTTIKYAEDVAAILSSTVAPSERTGSQSRLKVQPSLRPPLHIEIDSSSRTIGKKIQQAHKQGYNIVGVIGNEEMKNGTVTLEITSHQRRRENIRALLAETPPPLAQKEPAGGIDAFRRTLAPLQARQVFEQILDRYL